MRWEGVVGKPGSSRRFVLGFALWLAVLEYLFLGVFVETALFGAYLRFNAILTSGLLELCGADVFREGALIAMGSSTVEVGRGCDPGQPAILYTAAVLAFARPWPAKARALALGFAVISAVNLVRIASLVQVEAKAPEQFELVHLSVWPLVFGLVILILWTRWALRSERRSDPSERSAARESIAANRG